MQRVFGCEPIGAPGADVLRRAEWGAECNEATHLGGLAATPDLGPKVGDPWRCGATVVVEDAGLAQVSICLHASLPRPSRGPRWRVLGLGRAGGRRGRRERPWATHPAAAASLPGITPRAGPGQTGLGPRRSPCSHPSAWRMPWRTPSSSPSSSHHWYSEVRP